MVTQTQEPKKKATELQDDDPVHRSIGIGIACTILFHLLLLWLSPQFGLNKFNGVHSGIAVKTNKGKTFDFQLEPMPPEPPKQNAMRYVDTNPDAPENTPDKTPNISNRNQQSAQPDPAKEKDPENRPSITNAQDQIKNDTSIVTGNLAKPQQGASGSPQVIKDDSKQTQEELKARAEHMGGSSGRRLNAAGGAMGCAGPSDRHRRAYCPVSLAFGRMPVGSAK